MEKEVAEKTEHTALDFPHIKNILPMMEAVN
jgi:hypothetical protein